MLFENTTHRPIYIVKRDDRIVLDEQPKAGDTIQHCLIQQISTLYSVQGRNIHREVKKVASLSAIDVANVGNNVIDISLLVSGEWDECPGLGESWVMYMNPWEPCEFRISNITKGKQITFYASFTTPTEEVVGGWGLITEEEYFSFWDAFDEPESVEVDDDDIVIDIEEFNVL